MGHRVGSTFFVIIIILLIMNKTKLREKMNFTKLHKILGSIFVIYMSLYSIMDYIKDKEVGILLLIPCLMGITYTGIKKRDIKYKYTHSIFVAIFLITLLLHIFL